MNNTQVKNGDQKMDYSAKMSLRGKRALVTGAGRGIGRACAEALAATGAYVIVTDLERQRACETAEALVASGYDAEGRALDVTSTAELSKTAQETGMIDILICNAGVVTSANAEALSDEDWQFVIDVNLTGVFRTCRAFAPAMIAAGGGAIVTVGSMSGLIVNTPQPQCHYNASKAAVHQLTRSLAVEWAPHGLRVNAVAPTYIATPLLNDVKDGATLKAHWIEQIPMARLGEAHEVASAVQFLASGAASLITGTILNVDGGYTCR